MKDFQQDQELASNALKYLVLIFFEFFTKIIQYYVTLAL
jgi:hypothetical protein